VPIAAAARRPVSCSNNRAPTTGLLDGGEGPERALRPCPVDAADATGHSSTTHYRLLPGRVNRTLVRRSTQRQQPQAQAQPGRQQPHPARGGDGRSVHSLKVYTGMEYGLGSAGAVVPGVLENVDAQVHLNDTVVRFQRLTILIRQTEVRQFDRRRDERHISHVRSFPEPDCTRRGQIVKPTSSAPQYRASARFCPLLLSSL